MKKYSKIVLCVIVMAATIGALSLSFMHDAYGSGKTVTTPTGLQYEDVLVGKGDSPKTGNIVVVHYTGKFEDGKQFDSSVGKDPFKFPIGQGRVIKGWDEGVMTMKVGGKRKLIIPGKLAYGPQGIQQGGRVIIPPNATLIFDVELLKIEK